MTEEGGVTGEEGVIDGRDSCASAEATGGTLSAALGMTVGDDGVTGEAGDSVGADPSLKFTPSGASGLWMTGDDGVTDVDDVVIIGERDSSVALGMTGSETGVITEAGAAVAPAPFSICFITSSVTQVAPIQIFSV